MTRCCALLIFAVFMAPYVASQQAAPSPDLRGVIEPIDSYPDVAPDGRRIVFQSKRSGRWQLWLVGVDGSGLERLTFSEGEDTMPVWSPDGNRVLYVSNQAGLREGEESPTRDIYVIDVAAHDAGQEPQPQRIISHPGDEMHAEWADGGSKILFNRVFDTQDGSDIVLADTDGSGEVVVETGERGWNTYAAMTPDASRIVYRGPVTETRDGEEISNSDIISALPDGSDRIRLTTDPAFDGWPTVSPNGEKVAFSRLTEIDGIQRYHLFTVPVTGGDVQQVTSGTNFHYTQPAWGPDGTWLAVHRWVGDSAGEVGQIVIVSLEAE